MNSSLLLSLAITGGLVLAAIAVELMLRGIRTFAATL